MQDKKEQIRDTYVNRRSHYNYLSSCFINGRLSIQIPADRHFIPTFFLVLSTFPKGIPKINSKSSQLHFEHILWHFLFDATSDWTVRRGGTALDLYSEKCTVQFSGVTSPTLTRDSRWFVLFLSGKYLNSYRQHAVSHDRSIASWFQSQFSWRGDLVLPLSISGTLSFLQGHPVAI